MKEQITTVKGVCFNRTTKVFKSSPEPNREARLTCCGAAVCRESKQACLDPPDADDEWTGGMNNRSVKSRLHAAASSY